MKVARLLLVFTVVAVTTPCFSFSLRIHWQFTHVVEGYDWDNRLEIFLDGNPLATSDIYKQSAKGEVLVDIPEGKHTLELVDFVRYKGEWEKNTVANEYAMDAAVVKQLDLKASADLDVTFNIDKAKTTVKLKKPTFYAVEQLNEIPLTIRWKYENLVADHDYENRMVIYINGKREAESAQFRESQEGTFTFLSPFGTSDIRLQTEALYEGRWEEQIRQFDYSIDAFYVLKEFSAAGPTSIQLTFDIEAATVVSDLQK